MRSMSLGGNEEQSERDRLEAIASIQRGRQASLEGDDGASELALDDAWRCLERSLVHNPGNQRARILLVACAITKEDFERAREEALRIHGGLSLQQLRDLGDSVLHMSICKASLMLGNTEESARFANEAAQLWPEDPQPLAVLGELAEKAGRDSDAERFSRQALLFHDDPQCRTRLRPDGLITALCCLGGVLHRRDRHAEAEELLLRAHREHPEEVLPLRLLVDVYAGMGQPDEAARFEAELRVAANESDRGSRGGRSARKSAGTAGSRASEGSAASRVPSLRRAFPPAAAVPGPHGCAAAGTGDGAGGAKGPAVRQEDHGSCLCCFSRAA